MNDKDSVLRTPSDYHSKDQSFNLTVSFKILLVPLLAVMVSCSVVGAFETDDPYGPVVNCDADQPMDDLLKCVEKEYNKRTKGKYNSLAMDTDIFYKDIRDKLYLLKTTYKALTEFKNIKDCRDQCDEFINKNGDGHITKDFYEKNVCVHQDSTILSGSIYIGKDNPISKWRGTLWSSSFFSAPYKYSRSQKLKRDVIISKALDKLIIYAVLAEKIPIMNNKDIYIVNIQKLCPARLKDKPESMRADIYEYTRYSRCGVYRFEYLTDRVEDVYVPIPVQISLDRRINPKKIYIKIGKDIFEVDISNDFQLTYE